MEKRVNNKICGHSRKHPRKEDAVIRCDRISQVFDDDALKNRTGRQDKGQRCKHDKGSGS